MSLKRYATKRDTSEPAILQALAAAGADYILLDTFDCLVLYRGRLFMLENKTQKGKQKVRKTGTQIRLVERGWPLQFCTTPEAALKAIGAMK